MNFWKNFKEISGRVLRFLNNNKFPIASAVIIAVALIYRVDTFLVNKPFIHDESQLACNFLTHTGLLWMFQPLDNLQVAPPVFLLLTKLSIKLFGLGENAFRAVPFVSALGSVFAFYYLSKRFLKQKGAILLANFLFGINFTIVSTSAMFKQYSSDIFVFLLAFLWVSRIKLEDLTFKRGFLLGLGFLGLFLISQPSVFVFFGFIMYNFKHLKKLAFWPIPVILGIAALCSRFSLPQGFNDYMVHYWRAGFLGNFLWSKLFYYNWHYFLYGQKILKYVIPFWLLGGGLFALRGFKYENKDECMAMIMFGGLLVASILKFYPLQGRLMLFVLPFWAVFAAVPFEYQLPKFNAVFQRGLGAVVLALAVMFQCNFIFKNRCSEVSRMSKAREASELLKNSYKEGDIVIVPYTCRTTYQYYSALLGIKIDKDKVIDVNNHGNTEEALEEATKNRKPGQGYWFYLAYDGFERRTAPKVFAYLATARPKSLKIYQNTEYSKIYFARF